ncbi:hypothetical protein [Flavobacterium limi]|uniref:Uncharacterized protein n=1 Tax=Flavobacterium limi TaxID=2045105 RepID=A0ABQ1TYP1_9FLAO|nr:hypothetical protein [Flavobacterium limi]GGF07078.1 hypothetical protein GCM10011518_15440 [Flavobacterium limi]
MKNEKKFFFSKEENALELFGKLDRNQMSKIVGSYSERTYAESTGVKKPKPPVLKTATSQEAFPEESFEIK